MEMIGFFYRLHLTLIAFNPQQQVDEAADFPHVGILRSAHQQGFGVAGSDFPSVSSFHIWKREVRSLALQP